MQIELTDKEKGDTFDSSNVKREMLEVVRTVDDRFVVVNVFDQSILAIGIETEYNKILYEPVIWKKFKHAEQWVKSGCVGELQEKYCILNIGFRKNMVVVR